MGNPQYKKALCLDRITVSESGRKSVLEKKVEEFLCQDENSAIVPDKKKARKASLKVLHEKFLAEEDRDCSYSQFTRLVHWGELYAHLPYTHPLFSSNNSKRGLEYQN